ncbi:hypothetical protein [uncultured Helicobacter sp.]|uniref:hypothetical protein n=1 Tax=uncultured Helicobacter sp. TaxID=175537 RepID=UPI00261D24FF|nr:hypothetical protein [uncultured Helicobacter sp.]
MTSLVQFRMDSNDKELLETEANKRAYKKALKELENGETISHEELKKELGL